MLPVSVLALAIVSGVASVPTAAIYHTMDIVLVGPEDPIGIGDRVTMTAHILNRGTHAEPSSILADLNRGRANARVVTPVWVDVGVYQVQFDMLESDLAPGGTRVTVEATVGSLKDADWVNLGLGGLDVEIALSVARAAPGESITVTVRSRAHGAPRDVATLFLSADLLPVGQRPVTTILTPTRVALGTYEALYVIPADVSQETVVSFYARGGVDGRIGASSAYVLVASPSDLAVWYREVSVGDSSAVVEVLVSDGTGSSVPDAVVSLDFLYYTAWNPVIRQAVGITDDKGAARIDLEFPGAQWVVYFSGVVGDGAERQGFTGRLVLPQLDFAPLFDVLRENLFQFATPGEGSSLGFAAYTKGVPLAQREIYYTARTASQLIAHGSVLTDDAGRFNLSLAAPPGNVRVDFAANVGGTWAYDALDVPSARRLDVEVGDIVVGGRAKVRASLPGDHDAWVGLIALLPFQAAAGSLRYPWVQASATWGFYHLAVSDGTILEQEVLLPRFLPKDVDYLLYAYVIPQGSAGLADAYMSLESVRVDNRIPDVSALLSANPIRVGSELIVDASASSDVDGALAGFRIEWGDGASTEWSFEPVGRHVYERAGEYGLVVFVRDDNGAVASSIHHVQVEDVSRSPPQTFGAVVAIVVVGSGVAAATAILWRLTRRR